MKIFKFGGSVLKNSTSLCSATKIISNEINSIKSKTSSLYNIKHKNYQHSSNLQIKEVLPKVEEKQESIIIVVSALDKTTSLLEKTYKLCSNKIDYKGLLNEFYIFHKNCIIELNKKIYEKCSKEIDSSLEEIKNILKQNIGNNDLKIYDKILSYGEHLSSRIFFYYLYQLGIESKWLDAREFIKTDNSFGYAKVDFELTKSKTLTHFSEILNDNIIITQGFIGSTNNNEVTTLGKEGSDYSAAILASIFDSSSLTFWKDVEGIMNADPKIFSNPIKLNEISYKEMAEMSYYGAKIIHPKTFQPLYEKQITLYIKPFNNPNKIGTKIHSKALPIKEAIYTLKKYQCLITLYLSDYTFIDEDKINNISNCLKTYNIIINFMERSALSISICIDENLYKLEKLTNLLKKEFIIRYNNNVNLLTIKNTDSAKIVIDKLNKSTPSTNNDKKLTISSFTFSEENLNKIIDGKKVFLEKRNGKTFQIVYSSLN